MQLMSWTLARLGSRFSLLFEPHLRRVRHSGLGRFHDEPLDLMVGMVEPDGTERVLPFTQHGRLLYNCEQFERVNSITFRGYSEKYLLRFEFNVHSVFYPQEENLCTTPAFYLEMRVSPARSVRLHEPVGPRPDQVKLFLRLRRPSTLIRATDGSDTAIDINYRCPVQPQTDPGTGTRGSLGQPQSSPRHVAVHERIRSLNADCHVDHDGQGLTYDMPVSDSDSGVKWRLVWGAHCDEPVLRVTEGDREREGRFKYTQRLGNIDEVIEDAVTKRDDRLQRSRRFERLFDGASLTASQRHLINQTFQSFLSNTYWCALQGDAGPLRDEKEWFSVMEGNAMYHSTLDDEYNCSLFYLMLWPRLLDMQLNQWAHLEMKHEASGGAFLGHDMGVGDQVRDVSAYEHAMPVEENCNYVLLMQAHARWTGDVSIVQRHSEMLERLARYLIWTDADGSGFPSVGTPNTLDDASPASQLSRKQTYLAVKRLAALQAAGGLLRRVGLDEIASECERVADKAAPEVEEKAWLGDHYAVCVDRAGVGVTDPITGMAIPDETLPGWDSYSIYTANGLLLPLMAGQPAQLDRDRLQKDVYNSMRESMSPYGCGHSSYEPENVWISQNLWRDHAAQYLGLSWPAYLAQRYWDLQVMSNTGQQSHGYIDTYIGNNLCFFPRGVTSLGYMISHPRLVIDRLAPGGQRISVDPDRHVNQRWPLLPLADWKANKIPVCVVDAEGKVWIEGETDPVRIIGQDDDDSGVIG